MIDDDRTTSTLGSGAWLFVPGTHSPDNFDVYVWNELDQLGFNVFEFLLELITTSYEDPNGYLYNANSISCSRPRRDGDIDVDRTANDRVRHLRKVLKNEIVTGNKAYQLQPTLGWPVVHERLFRNPYLDPRILDRLKKSIRPAS